MHWKQEFIAAAGSLILALPAFGQAGTGAAGAPPPSTPPAPNTATRAPTDTGADAKGPGAVLGMIHHSNQSEIALASLAKQKSSNSAVKDYAEAIINDHQKADDEVQSFATSHNIALKQYVHGQTATGESANPMGTAGTAGGGTAEHKKPIDELSQLKGPEFDRQFTRTMADTHRKVIEHLKTIRANPTTDRDLAQLIDKLLPMEQKHDSAAQQLESSLSKAS